ncbi:PIG-L deacetylase family protein [Kitasatospora sp. NPDC094011]|uniref:PIG-L deacetylase family protein n=1 Tax=Kitasatospora sp. NPDC094011 TaxID=3364090 RepID=UPI00380E6C51
MADRHFRHRLDTSASTAAGSAAPGGAGYGPARWGRSEAATAGLGRAGLSRRQVLTAGALAGATVLGTGLSAGKASAASAPAIFYSPHQDDEALGLAGSILEHKAAGRPVYLVLVTRGENNQLAEQMNLDPCWRTTDDPRHPCAADGHHGLHWKTDPPSATDRVIVPARTAEFMASAARLGVDKVINLKVPDSAWNGDDDFEKFTKTVKSKIASIADQYPGASHKFTAGWLEVSATHKAISDAAVQLAKAGKLTDVRFNFVYAYDYPLASRRNGAAYVLNIPDDHMGTKRDAIACYNTWDPSRNLYALGYHSVPEKMESAAADPHEYVFGLPNKNYKYGDIGYKKDGPYKGTPQWGWS